MPSQVLTESQGSYDIQVKQNESDISAAKMRERFALMDFRRYLGQTVADKVIADANQMLNSEEKISGLIKSPDLGRSGFTAIENI